MDIFSRVAIESSAPFNYSFAILGGLDAKASPCNVGDKGSIPGSGRSAGEGNSKEQKEISLEYSVEGLMLKLKLQYSCLENPHGQRSLTGYSPWGCKELGTTERLSPEHAMFVSFLDFCVWRLFCLTLHHSLGQPQFILHTSA